MTFNKPIRLIALAVFITIAFYFLAVVYTRVIVLKEINRETTAITQIAEQCHYDLVRKGFKYIDPRLLAAVNTHLKETGIHRLEPDEKQYEQDICPRKESLVGDILGNGKTIRLEIYKGDTRNNLHLYGSINHAREDGSFWYDDGVTFFVTSSLHYQLKSFLPQITMKAVNFRSEQIDLIHSCEDKQEQGDLIASRALLSNQLANCEVHTAIEALETQNSISPEDMFLLGRLYSTDSKQGTRDTAKATRWFISAALTGSPDIQFQVANKLVNSMPSTSMHIFMSSAAGGSGKAALFLSNNSTEENESYFWALNANYLCLQEKSECKNEQELIDSIKFQHIESFDRMKIEKMALEWQQNRKAEKQMYDEKVEKSQPTII